MIYCDVTRESCDGSKARLYLHSANGFSVLTEGHSDDEYVDAFSQGHRSHGNLQVKPRLLHSLKVNTSGTKLLLMFQDNLGEVVIHLPVAKEE
jgi:hypothetical protein